MFEYDFLLLLLGATFIPNFKCSVSVHYPILSYGLWASQRRYKIPNIIELTPMCLCSFLHFKLLTILAYFKLTFLWEDFVEVSPVDRRLVQPPFADILL